MAPKLRAVPGAICLDSDGGAPPRGGVAALQTLREQHHVILEAAGEGIYGLDLEGRTTFVNPAAAQMTGHQVEELLGRSMHDIVHHTREDGTHYSRKECPIYAAFADGLVRNVGDEVFWRKDGSSFPVEYTSTPIIQAGRLTGAVVVFRDITNRRSTEDRLRKALSEVQHLRERLEQENSYLKERIFQQADLRTFIGRSPALADVVDRVRRAAPTDATVLVEGESGTGKELVCRALHELGPRRGGPLVSVNCAAISAHLIESELFGHERGAFTGATVQRAGRFELADGGTLFLDEVGELPLDAQAKLLRVLQEREFERVGGARTIRTTARVVAATNRDLRELVARGAFRADLYYRLYVLPIRMPPLRERREDIPLLAEHFRSTHEAKSGRKFNGFSPACLERMARYEWPGNVRELSNAVERAVLMCDSPWLDVGPLGDQDQAAKRQEELAEPEPESTSRLDTVEREHIVRILERTRSRIAGPGGAAELLGMHPNTLRYRLKKLGIRRA